MKKLIIAIIPLFLAFSCIDLDVKPRTGQTSNFVLIHAQAYKQYLAKLYASFSLTGQDGPAGNRDLSVITDEGFSSYIRVYWKAQELTTDEAVITWTDAGIQDLHLHNWSSENQFVKVLYYRIMYTIALTNDFLEQSVPEIMESNGVPSDDFAEIETFRHEARFLRALAYWHALDLYRNVPILTRIIAEPPVQATPQEVFDFIESELNDIENLLPAPHENQYGRADRGALWMLQAKLYLNAGVYTGQPKYTEVLTAVNKIINTGGYTLNADYRTLFMADNHTSNEIIFALNADGQYTQSWGSTTFLVHAPVGGTMVPADYGIDGGWAGLRATSTFVGKFADITGATDWRANFYTDGQTLDIADILTFANGYPIPKYTNIDSKGNPGKHVTFPDTDFPMFRLADAYLMYAEAVLRGGTGGDVATALTYVNMLRERAYGDTSGNISAAELTEAFLLDERARELHWEGHRRVDLIRFNQYTENGIWPWKGGVVDGITTSKHLNIFPLPSSEMIANPNLVQNTGY